MAKMTKKKIFGIIVTLFACIAVMYATQARVALANTAVIVPDPELHNVVGNLHAMAAALRLHFYDTRSTRLPDLDVLANYLNSPLPAGWPADYQIAEVRGGWWVGRRVPEFSTARRFLRDNAPSLGFYEQGGQNAWMGGAFVWMNAVPFGDDTVQIRVAQGQGRDVQYLFFNSPGTPYYWRSGLVFTAEAHSEARELFSTHSRGPFFVPDATPREQEPLRATPVELPPEFTVSRDEDEIDFRPGSMITLPLPRSDN